MAATAVFTARLAGTAGAVPATASTLAVAYNDAVITPHFPEYSSLWMGGYGWTPRGNHHPVSVDRDLRAHCMVIHDNGTPNVLLRLDVVSIPRDIHQEIRRRVVEVERLVATEDFMIVSSHTHSGPFVGDTHPDPVLIMGIGQADVDVINEAGWLLMDALVELVRKTVQEPPIEATLGYAEGSVELGVNRAGLPYTLPQVPVLLARDAGDGTPLAVLFGYACHPVARGRDEVYDSDYCGYAAERIHEELGILALFFQGCSGDIDPPAHGTAVVADLGEQLAQTVLSVIDDDDFTPVTGPFGTALIEVQLPFSRDLTNPRERADLAARYQARLDSYAGMDSAQVPWHTVRHAELMLRQISDGVLPTSIPMPIQRWRMGGLTILGLGHEVLSTFDVLLRARAADLGVGPLWIMAYANETQCYVAADDKMWMGGYEAGRTADDDTIAEPNSYLVSYGWPLPLNASPNGTDPSAVDSVETIVLNAAVSLLA
ncbi:hypothetical protein Acsp05_40670 [Actinokineospora sp. NBRC 105648]|nr:hypothetical protein Acsp05_40670 [Actinokineospora sp. NBRC 105648]